MKFLSLILILFSLQSYAALQEMNLVCRANYDADVLYVEIHEVQYPHVLRGDREVGTYSLRPSRFYAVVQDAKTLKKETLKQNQFSVSVNGSNITFINKKHYEKYMCKSRTFNPGPIGVLSLSGKLLMINTVSNSTPSGYAIEKNGALIFLNARNNSILRSFHSLIGKEVVATGVYYLENNHQMFSVKSIRSKTLRPIPMPPIKPPVVRQSFSGTLDTIYAIGGETTGIVLKTQSQIIELIGDDVSITSELRSMVGAVVSIKGYWTTKYGPERGPRKVFVVESYAERMIGPIF